MEIITVNHLCKTFKFYEKDAGKKGLLKNLLFREHAYRYAVKDVSFSIDKGEIVGFLGPNGAGKSTTLKMLSGILHPTSGTASVMGFTPWERRNEYKRRFSFVAGQKSQLWIDLPAHESFRLNKTIYDVPDKEYEQRVNELVELLDVKDFLKVQVRRLSLGERMKMELIASLIHKPEVLFLDEPTIGLDIISSEKIRNFIKEFNRLNQTTIILTSHYMRDIEELCNRTIIINKGEKVYDGSLQSIRSLTDETKRIKLKFDRQVDTIELQTYGKVLSHEKSEAVIEIHGGVRSVASELLSRLPVQDISIEDIPIEQNIALLYQGGGKKAME
jgi:ABC-2 type transport system ATP-binding protein